MPKIAPKPLSTAANLLASSALSLLRFISRATSNNTENASGTFKSSFMAVSKRAK